MRLLKRYKLANSHLIYTSIHRHRLYNTPKFIDKLHNTSVQKLCGFGTRPSAKTRRSGYAQLSQNGIIHITSAPYHPSTNGIIHITSAPYHPSTNGIIHITSAHSTNGLAERAVQTFKQGLLHQKVGSIKKKSCLASYLSIVCLPIVPQAHQRLHELLLGRRPRSRLDILHPDLACRSSGVSTSSTET